MNYNDQILENKAFTFFKQLMYNLALSICIMLGVVFILVAGFKFQLYEVLSDSQAPYFKTGDMVVVRPAKDYNIGDILTFEQNGALVTHRIIAIKNTGNAKTYYCHGDNVQSANPNEKERYTVPWREDSAYVQGLIDEGKSLDGNTQNLQVVTSSQIKGKVINSISKYGTYFKFVKEHYMLFIALVAGIWCISSVTTNELDMKKAKRLL